MMSFMVRHCVTTDSLNPTWTTNCAVPSCSTGKCEIAPTSGATTASSSGPGIVTAKPVSSLRPSAVQMSWSAPHSGSGSG